jgi:chorismate--pyruvate lyase
VKNPYAPTEAPLLPLDLWAPGAELLRAVPAALRPALAQPGPVRDLGARLIEQRLGFLNREQQERVAAPSSSCLVRDEMLGAPAHPRVFVEALVPDCTLELHPWLAELGDAALGATLVAAGGLEQGAFEFAPLPASHPLAARALAGLALTPATLWARRACYALRGRRLLIQEVFLPEPAPC